MTLEELLAAMNLAKASAEAKPEDEVLKKAFEDAKAAYDEAKAKADGSGNPDDLDDSKLDEKTKLYVAKLRKENASHRTKAKDLASKLQTEKDQKNAILKAAGILPDEKPEEKLKALSEQNSTLAFRKAILESALQNGISSDSVDYFEFLVAKATSELKEGEELEDSALAEIVSRVKKQSPRGGANSTAGASGGGSAPAPSDGNSNVVSLDKFVRMSMVEKSRLYETNKDLYMQLMSEARSKKKLV